MIHPTPKSSMPLSAVVSKAHKVLLSTIPNLTVDQVTEKIKATFLRESYLVGEKNPKFLNKFEDDDPSRCWRWEATQLATDRLPEECLGPLKKARTIRRLIRRQSKALTVLIGVLAQEHELLSNSLTSDRRCRDVAARVSNEEAKLLRVDQDEEKLRWAAAEKQKREEARLEKLRQKQAEKEEKERARKAAEEERLKKKEEAERVREEKKRKREEEKLRREAERRKRQHEEEAVEKRKKARMMSFFSGGSSRANDGGSGGSTTGNTDSNKQDTSQCQDGGNRGGGSGQKRQLSSKATKFNEEASKSFWDSINASTSFPQPAVFATKRRSVRPLRRGIPPCKNLVVVNAFVPVTSPPDSGDFGAQAYADLREIQIPNKMKLLQFQEDHRPPYYGTWSKTSVEVSGKAPMRRDPAMDYDYDSEAEWEEGDDEVGEDVEDEGADGEEENIDPDEGDTRKYNYSDGWLAADDDDVRYENDDRNHPKDGDGNVDGLAVEDGRKQLTIDGKESFGHVRPNRANARALLFVVAPVNGKPAIDVRDSMDVSAVVEGEIDIGACFDKISQLVTETDPDTSVLCMDAFPPKVVDGDSSGSTKTQLGIGPGNLRSPAGSPSPKKPAIDERTFARFVHGSTLNSKDKVVEAFRKTLPNDATMVSRAELNRLLDSVATKVKNPTVKGGYLWWVNDKELDRLDLGDLKTKTLVEKATVGASAAAVGGGGMLVRKKPNKTNKSKSTDSFSLKTKSPVPMKMTTKKKKTSPLPGNDDGSSKPTCDHQDGFVSQLKTTLTTNREKRTSPKPATGGAPASSTTNITTTTTTTTSKKRKSENVGSAKLMASFLVKKKAKRATTVTSKADGRQ